MRKKIYKSILLATCLTQLGCAGVKLVEDRKDLEKSRTVEDYSYDIHIPFFRYVSTPVDIEPFCKGKEWKDLYVSGTVLTGFVSVFTLGIVHPQKVEATCLN